MKLWAFKYRALLIGGLLLAAALLAFWQAARCETPLAANIWSNVGSALGTTGLVGIIYDSLLKPKMLSEIKSSLDIDASGITAIAPIEDLAISRWTPRHKSVLVVIPDLQDWLKHGDWRFLLTTAQKTPLTVTVYGHINEDDVPLLRETLSRTWEEPGPGGQSAAGRGSKLKVFRRSDRAQVSLYRSGDAAIVSFDAPFATYVYGAAVGLQLQASRSVLWEWVDGVETRVALGSEELCRLPATNRWAGEMSTVSPQTAKTSTSQDISTATEDHPSSVDVPWTLESLRSLLEALDAEAPVQAAALRRCTPEAGGKVNREFIYEAGGYEDERMLRGFTRPFARLTERLQASGDIPQGLSPIFVARYPAGAKASYFSVPPEVPPLLSQLPAPPDTSDSGLQM
ncbi:MAG: hypothetical protein IPL94_00120 [Tetrasphaera sp.]|nr:hypothetical protein [Tetrasphaera sp.]